MNTKAIPYTDFRTLVVCSFSLLWTLDTIFTLIFINQYGLEAEANPLMREVLRMGPGYFMLVKMAIYFFYMCVYEYMKTWIHVVLMCIMLPVTAAGFLMAVS